MRRNAKLVAEGFIESAIGEQGSAPVIQGEVRAHRDRGRSLVPGRTPEQLPAGGERLLAPAFSQLTLGHLKQGAFIQLTQSLPGCRRPIGLDVFREQLAVPEAARLAPFAPRTVFLKGPDIQRRAGRQAEGH